MYLGYGVIFYLIMVIIALAMTVFIGYLWNYSITKELKNLNNNITELREALEKNKGYNWSNMRGQQGNDYYINEQER